VALEGTLHDMSFADLFEVFHTNQHSGRLRVSRHVEHGLVFLSAGQVVDAMLVTDLDGASVASAEDALNRILAWPDADFSFEHDPTVNGRPRQIVRDLAWILATVTKAIVPLISLDSLLRPAPPSADAVGPVMLSSAEWRLISALWPQQTLGMACAELGLAAPEALALARSLLNRGLLAPPSGEASPPHLPYAPKHTQPPLSAVPPKLSARSQPAAPATASAKSLLLKAIIRRVRSL
jgi:hypothetical protein